MSYVDGFLLPVPKKNREAYRRIARKAGKVWREHGALANVECIADTRSAIEMKEGDYPPVYYFPRRDVKLARLARTAHGTHCPYKGNASYFSIVDGPENAVWSYEQP
ncbi:MAG: DUF1428 family protein [Betaproteobacteria bacterium]|nr:DUF1428 family protein [Betaproteobacteria bacterium]